MNVECRKTEWQKTQWRANWIFKPVTKLSMLLCIVMAMATSAEASVYHQPSVPASSVLRLGKLLRQELGQGRVWSGSLEAVAQTPNHPEPKRLLAIWGVGPALSVRILHRGHALNLNLKNAKTARLSSEAITLLSVRPPCAVLQTNQGRERLCMPMMASLKSESVR